MRQSAAHPRAHKIMEIAKKYPAAREAQMARVAGLQDKIEEAYAGLYRKRGRNDLTAPVLASFTLSVLSITFRIWFENRPKDIRVAAERAFTAFADLMGREARVHGDALRRKEPQG